MDLSKISTADLEALQGGDLSKVSTEGLQMLSGTPYGSGQSFDAIGGKLVPTGSPEAQAAQSPVSGNSFGRNALIGAGKMFTDLSLGARQIAGGLAPPSLSSLIGGSNLQQEAANKRQIDAPIMHTGGGLAGQIGTGALIGSVLPGSGYLGAIGQGAAFGALTPTVEGESRGANAAIGGALGAAGQFVGNRIGGWLNARAAVDPLTPGQQSALEQGAGIGLAATPGQATGNRALQQFEASLSSNPWSSGPFNRLAQANQRATGQAVAGAIGETGTSVDSTVLQNASDRLGAVFDSVRDPARISVVNPQATTQALDAIDRNYLGTFANNGATVRDNPLVAQLEQLTSQGSINGEQLGSLSSNLGRAANNQMTSANGDRQLGQALFDVQGHVHDLVQQTLNPDEAAQYTQALQQYRALRQVTNRVGNINPTTGTVSPVSLANYLQQTDRQGFLMGRNQSPMYTAARFGQAFKPVVNDSGTATRSWNPFSIAMGIPRSIVSNAYMSPLGQAAVRGGAAARVATAPPLAVGQALQPYLTGGLPGAGASLLPYLSE